MSSLPPSLQNDFDDGALGAYAAGELPEAEAAAIRARAEVDPVFAARVEGALRVEAVLREEALLPVPLSLLSRVLDRVRAEAPVEGAPPLLASSGRTGRGEWGWAAAAAVLALFLGFAPAALGVEPFAAATARIAEAPLGVTSEDAGRAFADGATALVSGVPAVPGVASLEPLSERVPGGASVLGAAGGAFLAVGLFFARRLGGAAVRT